MYDKSYLYEVIPQNHYNQIYNLYKEVVPSNIRMFAKQFINPQPITERNFTQQELDAMRDAYYNSQHTGDKKTIQYDDYPRTTKGGGLSESLIPLVAKSMVDKGLSTSYTLGRVNKIYHSPQGNVHLSDIYNFKPSSEFADEAGGWSEVMRRAHDIAAKYGSPMSVDINLGNPKNWKGY